MLAIMKFVNFFRPVRVASLESFVVFLKHLRCAEVTAEFLTDLGEDGADMFSCTIRFAAESSNGRRLVYLRKFAWSKRVVEIAHVEDSKARAILSERLRPVAEHGFTQIKKELPDIRVSVTDLDRRRLTLISHGRWMEVDIFY